MCWLYLHFNAIALTMGQISLTLSTVYVGSGVGEVITVTIHSIRVCSSIGHLLVKHSELFLLQVERQPLL